MSLKLFLQQSLAIVGTIRRMGWQRPCGFTHLDQGMEVFFIAQPVDKVKLHTVSVDKRCVCL